MTIARRDEITLKVFAWYEIISGLVGVVVSGSVFIGFLNSGFTNASGWRLMTNFALAILMFAMVAVYALIIYGGWCLWRGQYFRGFRWSFFGQYLQIPVFNFHFFAYQFYAGFAFIVGIKFSKGSVEFPISFYLESQYQVHLLDASGPLFLGLNIVPILLVVWLARVKNRTSLPQ